MITAHKAIHNLFGSGIYHKLHSIFKSNWYEFHNRNIGLFSGNNTRMAGYFIGMHRYICTRKAILATVWYAEFSNMALISKLPKVVSYIQDNKALDMWYILFELLFPCFGVLCLADSNKSVMNNVYYCFIMTKISIIKPSSDIDNKELFPVSSS